MQLYQIALIGNPNTGKSTLFNALTGSHQHTGNWPGKTVLKAEGYYDYQDCRYQVIDLPGTYSLTAQRAEEEVAANYLCSEQPDVVIAVADASCLERSLPLVLQTLEITGRTVVAVNLLDEARRKKIRLDLELLARKLGVPVRGISARQKEGLAELRQTVAQIAGDKTVIRPVPVTYEPDIEAEIQILERSLQKAGKKYSRWLALRLWENFYQI